MCYVLLNSLNEAIESFNRATKLDVYFAAAYFMRGYCFASQSNWSRARADFSSAYDHLRQNLYIDYTQLGMPYNLYQCEILYNRAMAASHLNDGHSSQQDLFAAQGAKVSSEHDVIDTALRTNKFGNLFKIPPLIFKPPEQKLKNAVKVDYLGQSKIVATIDENDQYIGFKDAQIRKMNLERGESPPPSQNRPPPAQNRPPPPSYSFLYFYSLFLFFILILFFLFFFFFFF